MRKRIHTVESYINGTKEKLVQTSDLASLEVQFKGQYQTEMQLNVTLTSTKDAVDLIRFLRSQAANFEKPIWGPSPMDSYPVHACQRCKQPLISEFLYCHDCNKDMASNPKRASIEDEPLHTERLCLDCHQPISNYAMYCSNCFTRRYINVPNVGEVPVLEKKPPPPPPAPKGRTLAENRIGPALRKILEEITNRSPVHRKTITKVEQHQKDIANPKSTIADKLMKEKTHKDGLIREVPADSPCQTCSNWESAHCSNCDNYDQYLKAGQPCDTCTASKFEECGFCKDYDKYQGPDTRHSPKE